MFKKNKRKILIITGLSGAGKTSALKVFEDIGYEAVDNLPCSLIKYVINKNFKGNLAIGIDIRSRDFNGKKIANFILENKRNLEIELIYFDCEINILINRYKETRRPHPLKLELPIKDIIKQEIIWLDPLNKISDHYFDTTELNVPNLNSRIKSIFALNKEERLNVRVLSFGYKYGVPREADVITDMRFIKNPFYVSGLRELSGMDNEVIKYIEEQESFKLFFKDFLSLYKKIFPKFAKEGKNYLTIAFGCTGGIHRSVVMAEKFSKFINSESLTIHTDHRDLKK